MSTAQEWTDQFNLEWNNIMSNQAPNLDLYEQSRFLTRAQELLVIRMYNGDTTGDGFESKELSRRQLANLIGNGDVTLSSGTNVYNKYIQYDVALKSDVLVIISEQAVLKNSNCNNTDKLVKVIPIKYDELDIVVDNPFRKPSNDKVLRLDKTTNSVTLLADALNVLKYIYEYLKKPLPIILDDFTNYGVEIDGLTQPQNPICQLDSALHRDIVTQAVQLAAAAWADKK